MKTIKSLILMLILILVVSSCGQVTSDLTPSTSTSNKVSEIPCGDGICEGPENPGNCPEDCTETLKVDYDTNVLYIGVMVHLEGWDDHLDQDKFERHAELVRKYADLFESYGAILTFESREFTDGCIKWDQNVLLEMEERGHDIGVHADIGGQQSYNCANFANDLQIEKEQLETLGVQVRHVSGNTSHCDWVTATLDAGYEFTTGGVSYNVMSIPEEERPEEFRFCEKPSECHDVFPERLEDRLHPTRALDGETWLIDNPNGELVLIPSSGGIVCMAEEAEESTSNTVCTYDLSDVNAAILELEQAIALIDSDQINTYYLSWSIGSPLNDAILSIWLEQVQEYVDSGQVIWTSLPDMYDVYLSWETDN